MTYRFNTWVEADTLGEAKAKLREICRDYHVLEALEKNPFTVTRLEDGDEDKANIIGELTVREVKEFCDNVMKEDCSRCPLYDGACLFYDRAWEWDIAKATQVIRGYKPEGEER